MSPESIFSTGRSENMHGRKKSVSVPHATKPKRALRCHIDFEVSPQLKAQIVEGAIELELDLSKFMRVAALLLLKPDNKEECLSRLIQEREDRDLERVIQGLFWLIHHVDAAGDQLREKEAQQRRIEAHIQFLSVHHGRELLRSLTRQVADLIEARRQGTKPAAVPRDRDMSPDSVADEGRSP